MSVRKAKVSKIAAGIPTFFAYQRLTIPNYVFGNILCFIDAFGWPIMLHLNMYLNNTSPLHSACNAQANGC